MVAHTGKYLPYDIRSLSSISIKNYKRTLKERVANFDK